MTVATGIVAIFECVVFSTTNYTIQWTRDGNPLTNNTRVSISGSELTINGVLESHEGTYGCIASNAAGTLVSEPAKLLVCGTYINAHMHIYVCINNIFVSCIYIRISMFSLLPLFSL